MPMAIAASCGVAGFLSNDGFVLHAKPVIDLRTNEVSFYELLIRLRAPEGILIPPSVFLYTAERFGMAVATDEWVTGRAIQLLEQMDTAHPLALGVNISGASLLGAQFITFLQAQLLIFELSEAVVMANLEGARRLKQSLVKLGCRLALDDFGAAFGSFFYLKHLCVDVVAEFVGDQETRQKLLAMGVHLGQGAFLGPACDIGEIAALQPHH